MSMTTYQDLKIFLPVILVLSAVIGNGAENLLVNKNAAKISSWGAIPNKPEGTGEVKLEGGVLTLTRKKLGGDFKFYTSAPAIVPDNEYRFLCKLKKEG